MIGDLLAWTALILAALPFLLLSWNLWLYRRPPQAEVMTSRQPVSILIPARNESAGIEATVSAALATKGVPLEVIVLDDHSDDDTAEIVTRLATSDSRLRLEFAPPLPLGWCGKQHACQSLAGHARHEYLIFLDADVRLMPDCVPRSLTFLQQSGAALVSGVPHQQTETFGERLLIPLIHFVLLGFLPIWRMRRCTKPAYAAGCGQFFLTRQDHYQRVGGHAGLRASLHDGLHLPRLYRSAGLKTDLFDATSVASCRMYHDSRAAWQGLQKNAIEGLAAPRQIVAWTILLGGGQVLPFLLLMCLPWLSTSARWLTLMACGCSGLSRILLTWRFRQSWLGAVLHPLGVVALLAVQWTALFNWLRGRPSSWKGRSYGVPPA